MCSSGPGQYNPNVKSFPQMALISSREDRFKVSVNTNPGPGAYQVKMQLKLHFTLIKQRGKKNYFPFYAHIPHDSNFQYEEVQRCASGCVCPWILMCLCTTKLWDCAEMWLCAHGPCCVCICVFGAFTRCCMSDIILYCNPLRIYHISLCDLELCRRNWLLCKKKKKNPNLNKFLWFHPISLSPLMQYKAEWCGFLFKAAFHFVGEFVLNWPAWLN